MPKKNVNSTSSPSSVRPTKTQYRFKPVYRAYVKLQVPESDYEQLSAFEVENVGQLVLDLVDKGYQVTIEPVPSGRWSATAYGVATDSGSDDGIGVSAESVYFQGAIAAVHYKVVHLADCALWKFVSDSAVEERKLFY